jgi:hypothetical protein
LSIAKNTIISCFNLANQHCKGGREGLKRTKQQINRGVSLVFATIVAQRRREIIKPHLHRDYIELCSQEVPVTCLLFGDDPHSGSKQNWKYNKSIITRAESTPDLQAKYEVW